MEIVLNNDERRDLKAALEAHLNSLRNELAHTDDRTYRRTVRQTLDRLESVAKKLSAEPIIKS